MEKTKKGAKIKQVRDIAISMAVLGFIAVVAGIVLVLDSYRNVQNILQKEPSILPDGYFEYVGYGAGLLAFVTMILSIVAGAKIVNLEENIKRYTNTNLAVSFLIMGAIGLFLCCGLIGLFVANLYGQFRNILLFTIVIITMADSFLACFVAAAAKEKLPAKKQ